MTYQSIGTAKVNKNQDSNQNNKTKVREINEKKLNQF